MSWKENQTSLAHFIYMSKTHSSIIHSQKNDNSLHSAFIDCKFDRFHIEVMKRPLFVWNWCQFQLQKTKTKPLSVIVYPVSAQKGKSWSEASLTNYDDSKKKSLPHKNFKEESFSVLACQIKIFFTVNHLRIPNVKT